MARIRSIHPGILTDEAWISLPALTRWCGIGLLMEADDQGIFEWKPLSLKMRLLPGDEGGAAAMAEMLAELEAASVVAQFTVNGRQYGAVRNFRRFQRPRKPNAIHPMTEEMAAWVGVGDAPEDDEAGGGGEPGASGSGGGSARRASRANASSAPPPPPNAASAEPERVKGASVPKKSENPPQMEDGGGKREDGEEDGGRKSGRASVGGPTSRGTRLPPGWHPDPDDARFAESLGLNPVAIAQQFRDYWHAKPGKDAVKLDWSATWRNWCRREAEGGPQRQRSRPGGRDHSWMADAARELGLPSPFGAPDDGRVIIEAETGL